jgi:hypothetical protein
MDFGGLRRCGGRIMDILGRNSNQPGKSEAIPDPPAGCAVYAMAIKISVWVRLLILVCLSAPAHAAEPRYALTARRSPDFRLLTPVRINGAGPFSCMFDSGGTPLSLDTAAAAKAGLKPNGQGETAAEGPLVTADQRIFNATVDIGPFSASNRTIVLRPLGDPECVLGTAHCPGMVISAASSSGASR